MVWFVERGSDEMDRGRGRGGPVLSMSLTSKPVFSSCFGLVWFVERGSNGMDRGREGRERPVLSTLSKSGPIFSSPFGSVRFVERSSCGEARELEDGRERPMLSAF